MIVACSSGRRGGRTWMHCDGSLTYWLSEPSTSRPKSPATRQRLPAPRRHESQRPQAMMIDDDVLSRLHFRYAFAQRIDHAGRLVAHHHRIPDSRVLPYVDRKVGVADRCRGGAYDDFAGPGDGFRAVDEVELPRRMKHRRPHPVSAHLASLMRRCTGFNGRREWSSPASDPPR